jgi:hypothetical protein
MLSDIPWIKHSNHCTSIKITTQIQLHKSQPYGFIAEQQSGNEPPSSSRATCRHVGT